ncbi:nuclease-related domain-containing protein [Alkalibacterium putridalgicola]|uniref:nuclease-related domain-containing protein n=1 Tax=Alkalibacterium putridalgicola TaxID=426703 RepID=UPI0034CD89B0
MILKERSKSVSHRILESLNNRMVLSSTEKGQYENQIKGFDGELSFDRILNESDISGLIINDLLLTTRDTFYQIDSLLITDETIYLFEVKNYSGTYVHKNDSLYASSGYALQDPVAQAERKRAYLHNLLIKLGHNIDIQVRAVFIHPDCYIYDLPKRETILFASQLPGHFKKIAGNLPKQSDENLNLAQQLITRHDDLYRPTNLPAYSFDQLKKGIRCFNCDSFSYSKSRQNIYCNVCGHKEAATKAIYRSIEEFKLLFPDIPLSKEVAHTWCGNDWKKSRIRRVLENNYRVHNRGRGSYYTDD